MWMMACNQTHWLIMQNPILKYDISIESLWSLWIYCALYFISISYFIFYLFTFVWIELPCIYIKCKQFCLLRKCVNRIFIFHSSKTFKKIWQSFSLDHQVTFTNTLEANHSLPHPKYSYEIRYLPTLKLNTRIELCYRQPLSIINSWILLDFRN